MRDVRNVLLQLICAAPDPCGFEKTLPHYATAWSVARAVLRETCPEHIVDAGGTCPNCHDDTLADWEDKCKLPVDL